MSDMFHQAERPPVSRPRRLGQILLLFLLVVLAALFVEHWRGEQANHTKQKSFSLSSSFLIYAVQHFPGAQESSV